MSVRRSLIWSVFGQLLSIIAMVTAMIVLARMLTPREMGVYAVGLAAAGILQIVAAFGLSHFVTREHELTPETLSAVFTINALLAALLAATTYALSYAGAALFTEPGVAPVLRLLAWVPVIGALEFLPSAILQRDMRFKSVSIVLICRSIGATVTTILSVLAGASYLSAAYGAIAYALIGAAGVNIALPGHMVARPGLYGWRRIVPFGLRVMSIGGISVLAMRMSELVIGRIAGLVALGIYSRASTLYNAIYTNVFGVAARVLFAKLAKDNRETGQIGATYLHGLQIVLAIMWPLLLSVAVLAAPIIYYAFGPRWLAAALPLAILMVAQALAMLFAMSYEVFTLRDELQRQTRYEVIRSLFGLACVSLGCLFSLEAAALGRVVEAVLASFLYVPHLVRLTGVRLEAVLRIFVGNLLIALTTVAPVFAVMSASAWRADVPLPFLAAGMGAGGLAWIAGLWLSRHPLFDELGHALHFLKAKLIFQKRIV